MSSRKRGALGFVRKQADRRPSGKWAIFLNNLTMICHYCGAQTHFEGFDRRQHETRLTLDHIHCEAIHGKSNRIENFVECCSACNVLKDTIDYFEFSLFAEFYLKPLRVQHPNIHSYSYAARQLKKKFFGLPMSTSKQRRKEQREVRFGDRNIQNFGSNRNSLR